MQIIKFQGVQADDGRFGEGWLALIVAKETREARLSVWSRSSKKACGNVISGLVFLLCLLAVWFFSLSLIAAGMYVSHAGRCNAERSDMDPSLEEGWSWLYLDQVVSC